MISIAVLGYGTVGSGVVEVLEKNKDVINQRAGDEISVKYVLDLRDFPGDPIQEKIVHDIDVIINDPEGNKEPSLTREVSAGITGVKFIHDVAERGKIVITFQTVYTVVDGNQTNTTLPQNLHNLTDLQIVAS